MFRIYKIVFKITCCKNVQICTDGIDFTITSTKALLKYFCNMKFEFTDPIDI